MVGEIANNIFGRFRTRMQPAARILPPTMHISINSKPMILCILVAFLRLLNTFMMIVQRGRFAWLQR